jgi:hypothetical protein
MAKLTTRSLATGVTTSDLIHIVIPSDVSQDPNGSSYKASIQQVFDAFSSVTFTGGTVPGSTTFTNGLTANTLSATTYQNLPVSALTEGTNIAITNTSGNHTISVTGITGGSTFTGGTVTGDTTFTSGLTANTISATTYQNLPVSGLTEGSNISLTNNNGNFTIEVTGVTGGSTFTGGTVSGETIFTSGITANTISATTIGTSGNCVDDIYVYNIHSCSPLNINPLNEGNVYFGQTSGITIDVTNNRLGINNPTPTYPLDILGNGNSGSFYYTPSSAGGITFLSGTTTTPTDSIVRYGVSTPSYLTKPTASMTFGIRGWGDSAYIAYGNNGDGFIRASIEVNGLTFIKAQGSGTSDYIRFFAGSNPIQTPNLMINGTGATQGFVGINTSTPSERLHVSGNTLISGGLTVSGLTATTVSATTYQNLPVSGLTAGSNINVSGSSGNFTITFTGVTGGSTFTGGTVTGATSFTNGLTANTLSATTYQNLPVSALTEGTNISITNTSGNHTISVTGVTGGSSINPYNNSGSGSTISWDVSGVSTNYEATLTAATTLNLTNVRNGDFGTIIIKQDSVGSRTLSLGTISPLGTHRVANGGGGSIILTSNASAIDILTFTYNGSIMFWTVGNDYT